MVAGATDELTTSGVTSQATESALRSSDGELNAYPIEADPDESVYT
jgi:hypothetical protein